MDNTSFYVITGLCIIVAGIVWVRLLKDNAKQEKLIAKHNRDIAGIRNKVKNEQNLE